MGGIAGKILDIFDDPGAALVKEASQRGVSIPAFVITNFESFKAPNLPDDLYAHVEHTSSGPFRKYACDTAHNTWLSNLYFVMAGGTFPEKTQEKIAARLVAFSQIHGIEVPDFLVKVAAGEDHVPVPERVTPDLPSAYWALTETVDRPMYPIATWEQVKAAEDYFVENFHLFAPAQRREYSVKLANRVRDLSEIGLREVGKAAGGAIINKGEDGEPILQEKIAIAAVLSARNERDPAERLNPAIQLYASTTPDEFKMAAELDRRIKLASVRADDNNVATAYSLLWANRGNYTVDKFAQTLENIDRAAGFERLWADGRLSDPYLSILKLADDPDAAVVYETPSARVTAGQVKKLAAYRQDLLKQSFDEHFAREFAYDPVAAFEALPPQEKEAVAALAVRETANWP